MSNGQYFVNFDYAKVSELLFNTNPNSLIFPLPPIKIGSKLLPIPAERVSLYTKPMVSWDKKTVEYYFEPRYIWDSKEPTELNIDEFIATLWKKWIYHGIDITRIAKAISESEQWKIVIAKETPPTKTIHPKFEAIKSLKIESKPKGADSNARIDMRVHAQALLECIKIDEALLRKMHGSLGEEGWTIFGKRIDPEPIQDFDVHKYLGNGVKVQVIDGYDCICSTMVGFIYFKKWKLEKGEYIDWFDRVRIAVKMEIEDIGMKTGKIDALKSIETKNDIKEDIDDAEDIEAKANVGANITARGNIKINGNVYGNIDQNQRSMAIPQGRIKSMKGNIKIGDKAMKSYIEAINGSINIGESQNSTIIGKTIEIGSAHNSLIVGDTVIISWTAIWCQIIAKNIIIGNSSSKRQEENICTIFSHDLTPRIEEKEKLQQKILEEIERIEKEFDDSFMSKIKMFESMNAEKRIPLTRVFVDILLNATKSNEQTLAVYNSVKWQLIGYRNEWEIIAKLKTQFTQLSEEIKTDTLFMEKQTQTNSIDIKVTTAPTHIRHIRYSAEIKLFDLLIDEIKEMAKLQPGREIAQYCDIQALPIHTSGKFSWKAA